MVTTRLVYNQRLYVYIRGRLVLQKWIDAGTGGGRNSFYGPGETISRLPDGSLYVSGDFPDGWRNFANDV
jgi:hypothetical protein